MDRRLLAKFWTLTVAVATLIVFPISAWAAAGDLDSSFGIGGKVVTDFTPQLDLANATAIQADGKILAAGQAGGDFGLARYNTNGSLDGTFGNGGKVTTDFALLGDSAQAMAVQPDGRIVLAGWSFNDFALARYLANGQLDTLFGVQGKVVTDFFAGSDRAFAVAIQPDRKIIAAGRGEDPVLGGSDFALARYNPDGSPDLTFGIGGQVMTNLSVWDGAEAVLIQPDEKIVAAGWGSYNCDPDLLDVCLTSDQGTALVRYESDGSLDQDFGVAGEVIVPSEIFEQAYAAALQPDGKIVLAGVTSHFIAGDVDVGFLLRRHHPDGSLDLSFSGDGTASEFFDTSFDRWASAQAVAIQPDDRIVSAGFIGPVDGATSFAIARHLADGSIDSSFGTGGKVTAAFEGPRSEAYSTAIQPDGKIVAAGNAGGRFGLIRLLGTTAPAAPTLSASAGDRLARLSWTVPSNGGSPITGYRIYRGTSSGSKTLRASVATVTTFDDTQVTNGTTYYYQVSAVNSIGEGPRSNEAVVTPKAPPDTTITSGPSGSTSSTSATFAFTSNVSPVTFECRLDGSAFTACSSPKSYTGLANGSHTFEVQAKDSSGLADPTPATRTWRVDTIAPPAPTLLSPGNGATTSNTKPTFDWSDVTDPSGVTYQLQVDNSGTGFPSPEINRTGLTTSKFTATSKLAKAIYYWRVRATDGAGNVGAWSSVFQLRIV